MKFTISFAVAAIVGVKANQSKWGQYSQSTDFGLPGSVSPATISQPPSYSRSQYSSTSYDGPNYNKATSDVQNYGQNSYVSKPDYNQGSYGSTRQHAFNQDSYSQDSYGQDSYGQESYGQDSYGHESYGLDSYGQESYGLDSYDQDSYGQDSYGKSTYAEDSYAAPSYGLSDSFTKPTYGRQSYGNDSYSRHSNRYGSYGRDSYSQPSYEKDSIDQKVGSFGQKTFGGETFNVGSFGKGSYGSDSYGSDSYGYGRGSFSRGGPRDSRASQRGVRGARSSGYGKGTSLRSSHDDTPFKSKSFGIGSRSLGKPGLKLADNDLGDYSNITLKGMGFNKSSLSSMGFSSPNSPTDGVGALNMKNLGLGVVSNKPAAPASPFGHKSVYSAPASPNVPKRIGGLGYTSAPKKQTYDHVELAPSKVIAANRRSHQPYKSKQGSNSFGYDSQAAPQAYDTPQYYAPTKQSYESYSTPAFGGYGDDESYGSFDSVDIDVKDTYGDSYSAPAYDSYSAPSYGDSYSAPTYGDSYSAPSYGDSYSAPTYGDSYSAPAYDSYSAPSYDDSLSAPIAGKSQFGITGNFSGSDEASIDAVPELGSLDSKSYFQSDQYDSLDGVSTQAIAFGDLNHSSQYGSPAGNYW